MGSLTRIGLVQDAITTFGGSPLAAARHVAVMADRLTLIPLWLEQGNALHRHVAGKTEGWRVGGRDTAEVADRLIAAARQENLQGLHLFGAYGHPLAAALAAAHLELPLVVSFRGTDINLGIFNNPRLLETLAAAATACTVLNGHQERLARRLFGVRAPVFNVTSHVNLDAAGVAPADLRLPRPVVGCVAEFRRLTGLDVLLEAFARMARLMPVSLLLVGPLESLEATYYSRLLDTYPARDRVLRTGAVGHDVVAGHMAACDLMVFPSVAEGMPNKVLEAMAVGVPVIASRIPGIVELIDDGIDGRLVEPRDARSLQEAMAEALADRELRRRWAARAKEKVAAVHTRDREREDWLACYRAAGLLP
ncbi:MAG: glycosyltransferase family 4 protein [Candidatus Riflebacteria bacterium]|nr:glycosyltransferase family 4 protein [Candidatus Riflebacteria bacterium]